MSQQFGARSTADQVPAGVDLHVMATPFGRRAYGFETQFATNYLGHFALINWIEPLLVDNVPRHFSEEDLRSLLDTVATARADSGLSLPELLNRTRSFRPKSDRRGVWMTNVPLTGGIGTLYPEGRRDVRHRSA